MTTLTDVNSPRAFAQSQTGYFYFYMALACMAVAFLGFAPTYWLPLAKRSFSALPVVHFHGLLFFAWSLYFAFQSWLAASGKVARHRTIGMIGVSLATAMTIFGFLVPVTIPPAFVAYLLLVAAMVFDWRTRGRPHPVYVYGGPALIAVKLLNWPISATPLWHSVAGGILAMAQ